MTNQWTDTIVWRNKVISEQLTVPKERASTKLDFEKLIRNVMSPLFFLAHYLEERFKNIKLTFFTAKKLLLFAFLSYHL